MDNLNEKFLNVTLKNAHEEHEEEQISISIVGILKNLRRFFALWLSATIFASILALVATSLAKQDSYKKMVSLVSFTYDGVEKGLDPKGNEFNINTLKSPQIIEKTLNELGLDSKMLEDIRKNISFESIKPKDALEKLTAYKNIFDANTNNSISAIDKILDTNNSTFPTQYKVYFDYAPTGLSSTQAAAVLNTMLEGYSEYFSEAYGYNKSLGSSLTALDYKDYDYAEAIDVFDSTLMKLSNYVKQVATTEDAARFRSSETGFTFADLNETISTVRKIDLDRISSFVTVNTISKDKNSLLTYYMFRVEELERQRNICTDNLASVNASIANYEKNTIMMFGTSENENMNISASRATEEYDRLFEQKQIIQEELSTATQNISLYNKRIERLNSSTSVNSSAKKAKVEEDLEKLNSQIENLIDLVNKTTDDYYETVVFSKAYNILVPANSTYGSATRNAIKDAAMPIVIADAIIFVIYFAIAVILSCIEEYAKTHESENKKKEEEVASAT